MWIAWRIRLGLKGKLLETNSLTKNWRTLCQTLGSLEENNYFLTFDLYWYTKKIISHHIDTASKKDNPILNTILDKLHRLDGKY